MKHSNQSTAVKSNNVSPNKFGSPVKEIPLDPQSRYSISYVPGMVEHEIDTGKTFEDAKMKIVLLTCELERVNTYNYSLVRENEVLRVQANKSEREKDLETKLAIVLAENEKLNQVIEELYEVYMSQRNFGSNEEYEHKLSLLYQDLDEWKQKYNVLESQNNVVHLQNELKEISHEKEHLEEQLARKDRDLEALRGRLHGLEENSEHHGELEHQNAHLAAENAALAKELEAIKLKYGKAGDLQIKLGDYDNKIRTILAENEKLNDLVLQKNEEVKNLKAKLDAQNKNNKKDNDIKALLEENDKLNESLLHKNQENIDLKHLLDEKDHEIHLRISQEKNINEHAKKAAVPNREAQNKLQELIHENEALQEEIHELRKNQKPSDNHELDAALHKAVEENKKLTTLLKESEQELRACREAAQQARENKAALERLSGKIKELIAENETLNQLVLRSENASGNEVQLLREDIKKLRTTLAEKQREIEDLHAKLHEVQHSSHLNLEYKDKIILITNENERLNNIIAAKLDEIEALRRRVAALETNTLRSSHSEVHEERIRSLLVENQRLNDLCRDQMREIEHLRHHAGNSAQISELLTKISLISAENERLNADLNALKARLAAQDREITHLRDNQSHSIVVQHNTGAEHELEHAKRAGAAQQQKIHDLEGRLSQLLLLETKVNYLNLENESAKKQIAEKDNLIHNLSHRLAEKDAEIAELRKKLAAAEAQNSLATEEIRIRIIAEQERKLLALREEMEAQIRRLVAEKREAEDKARLASIEADKLQHVIRELQGEIEIWRRRCADLEANQAGEQELREIREQFENLKHLNMEIKDLQHQFNAERTAYETQILQLEQTVNDLQVVNSTLKTENERVSKLSISRLSTIEELKRSTNEESHKLEVYELRNQIGHLKSSSHDVKELAIKYSSEKAADQAKINELIQLNANNREEVEKLRELVEQRKHDVESLTAQNEDLRQFCETLKKKSEADNSTSNVGEIEQLESKVAELEVSRNEFKRQAERNAIELTRKNSELVNKIQELDVLKLKYEEALANYQALNNQLFTRLSVNKKF